MKFNFRALCITSSLVAALFSAATVAHATTIVGSVWENSNFYPNPIPASTAGLGAPSATFTVNAINFLGTSGPSYTIAGFLNSTPGTLLSFSNPGIAGHTMDNTIYEFKGFVDLPIGDYIITHDDGVFLYLNGVMVINAGTPTSPEDSTFHVSSATGIVPFDLIYGEVNGAPGVLTAQGNFNADLRDAPPPVPEPSTIALLGTGLLGAAGMVRRRFSC